MAHNFINWDEALTFMFRSSDPLVVGALSEINKGIQSCVGLSTDTIKYTKEPSTPLDLLWFYKGIATIIHQWNATLDLSSGEVEEAKKVIDEVSINGLDNGTVCCILKFSHLFTKLDGSENVDVSFCVWLFSECIILSGTLPLILDGTIARVWNEHANADFETWAKMWT